VAEKNTTTLLARAFQDLKPGGLLLVHDLMVENDRPTSEALWLLTFVLMDVDALLLTPGSLAQLATKQGYADISVMDVISTIKKIMLANKDVSWRDPRDGGLKRDFQSLSTLTSSARRDRNSYLVGRARSSLRPSGRREIRACRQPG